MKYLIYGFLGLLTGIALSVIPAFLIAVSLWMILMQFDWHIIFFAEGISFPICGMMGIITGVMKAMDEDYD